jgi:hypothetical protein
LAAQDTAQAAIQVLSTALVLVCLQGTSALLGIMAAHIATPLMHDNLPRDATFLPAAVQSHKVSPEFGQLTAFEPLMRLHGWTYAQVISLVDCASVERMGKNDWMATIHDDM